MTSSSATSNDHEEIRMSMDSIIGISEGWLDFLGRRQRQIRLAKSFLTAVLVCAGSAAVFLAIVLEQDSMAFFLAHPETTLIILCSLLLVGSICGVAAYVLLGRRENPQFRELSELIERTKANRSSKPEGESTATPGITGSAMLETERMLELLPQLVRKRNQDALLFGIVAFVISSVLARPPIGILVGTIVWLYFRYETNRTYEGQISKIEEQRMIFERRKEEFLKNL